MLDFSGSQIFTDFKLNQRKLPFLRVKMVEYWQFHIVQLIEHIHKHLNIEIIFIYTKYGYSFFFSSFENKTICNFRNKVASFFFTFSISTKIYVVAQLWYHYVKAEFMLCCLLKSFARYFAALIY